MLTRSLDPFSEAECCYSRHLWPWVLGQPGHPGEVSIFPSPMHTDRASLREKSLLMLISLLR